MSLQDRKHQLHAFCVATSLLALACGGDTGGRKGNTDPVVENTGSCAPEHLTATCTCADQGNIPGRQSCASGAWSACECLATTSGTAGSGGVGGGAAGTGGPQGVLNDPPGNSSANRFAWKRTPFELGSCKAGHYVGNFMGWYRSPAAFTAPIPVASLMGADALPGLEFTLTKVAGTGELFRIDGGKMRGTANGLFPFSADLTGMLDCATKKYVGTIENGEYDVLGTKFPFIGTMTADYDKIQNKFIAGKWICTEPMSPFPLAGGEGDWDTTWQPM